MNTDLNKMPENLNMSADLNKIIAFHTLVIGKEESEKRRLAEIHEIDFEEYKRRIVGKEKETEFLVILRALKALKHIEAYDEEVSRITDEKTSDYKVELADGYKMLIEVKHTDKEKYSISNGNLQARMDFAKAMNLPLRFAISIKGYWGLFTAEYLQSKNGKITLSDFISEKGMTSTWDNELETCSFLFPKNIQIKSVYAHNHHKSLGVSFDPYGELVSYELSCNGKRIIRVKGKNSKDLSTMILIEGLQDRLANCEQEIYQDNGYTIIIDKTQEINMIPEYQFLLAIIEHMNLSELDTRDDNISYVSTQKDFQYPTLEYVRSAMSILVQNGLDIAVFKGNVGYRFDDYQRNFWVKR